VQCDWEGVGFALVAVKSGSTEQVAKELAAGTQFYLLI
jgi:hypothetical protein